MKDSKTESKYFLALTGQIEYWDTSCTVVILGPWCLRYKRRFEWQGIRKVNVKSPWLDNDRYYKAFQYVLELSERVIGQLSEKLNYIHDTNYDVLSWKMMLMPWVFHYISVMYDRYISVISAYEQYPNMGVSCFSEDPKIVACDTANYISLANDDEYNMQVYTRIINHLKLECTNRIEKQRDLKQHVGLTRPPSNLNRILKGDGFAAILNWLINKTCNPNEYFYGINLPLKQRLKLFLDSKGEIAPMLGLTNYSCGQYCGLKRQGIGDVILGLEDFEVFLCKHIIHDIPTVFVEGYSTNSRLIDCKYNYYSDAILSGTGWYWDEAFKLWAMKMRSRGSTFIGIQHGAGYGVNRVIFTEFHEKSITSMYFSWGWCEETSEKKIIPYGNTKMVGLNKNAVNKEYMARKKFLFVLNSTPIYQYRFDEYNSYRMPIHLLRQEEFVRNLNEELFSRLTVRPYFVEYGWCEGNRLKDTFPEINIEDSAAVPGRKSVDDARIVIYDQLSTGLLECLSMNKPVLCYYDATTFSVRPEAEEYVIILKHAGILFDSVVEAAKAAEFAYKDTVSWWNERSRQNAINEIVNKYSKKQIDTNVIIDKLKARRM